MSRNITNHKKNNNTATEGQSNHSPTNVPTAFVPSCSKCEEVHMLVRTATDALPTAAAVAGMHFLCTTWVCSGSSDVALQLWNSKSVKYWHTHNTEQINQNKQFKAIQSVTHATNQWKTHEYQAKQRKTAQNTHHRMPQVTNCNVVNF